MSDGDNKVQQPMNSIIAAFSPVSDGLNELKFVKDVGITFTPQTVMVGAGVAATGLAYAAIQEHQKKKLEEVGKENRGVLNQFADTVSNTADKLSSAAGTANSLVNNFAPLLNKGPGRV